MADEHAPGCAPESGGIGGSGQSGAGSYWRRYFDGVYDAALLREFERNAVSSSFRSEFATLPYDLLPAAGESAPLVVIVPGSIAYGRLFAALSALLVRQGMSAVTFDYAGTGEAGRPLADFSVAQHIANITDLCTELTRLYPRQPIVLLGLSYGGYMSFLASRRTPVAAMCWYAAPDPTSRKFVKSQPGFSLAVPVLTALARLFPRWPVPLERLVDYGKVSASTAFLDVYRSDPGVTTRCTLRSLVSLFGGFASPHDLADLSTPTLVAHCRNDRLFASALGQDVFSRIGSPAKEFIEIEGGGHWPSNTAELTSLATAVGNFLRAQGLLA
ncbi:alpha/beta fold hydrolase [Paracoccus aminophilus]|uniref:Alpha/beta hydrolase n=1 Tax=Paracoccus aminophilus JCM 7686 TaxID=1367847 RepID=S5XXG1_PARAH|nr:alpha/beta fold hydrolase [Paracoccus aminophilus]AGT08115.1 alpha/beta hydrolase [Paracoccus aminophilus JCM 7686]